MWGETMTDNHDLNAPNTDTLGTVPSKPSRGLRWRSIPGTFLAIFCAIGVMGSAAHFFTVAYYNLKYGWIEVDPEIPRSSELAITLLNVSVWQCGCWGTVAAGVAAYCWFQARWQLAWLGTGIFFALMFTAKWLESR